MFILGIHKGTVETMINGQKKKVNTARLITPDIINTLIIEATKMDA
jgi:hypothetical protein